MFLQPLLDAKIAFEVVLHPGNQGCLILIERGIQIVPVVDRNGPGNIVAKELLGRLAEVIILYLEQAARRIRR